MANIIMTVIGTDRSGLVDQLSATITDHGGNWLESRMSRLSGYFAGILRVSVPEEQLVSMEAALQHLTGDSLQLVIAHETAGADEGPQKALHLEVLGPDHPGIVHDISHALATKNIGISSISTDCRDGAMSSERIFSADINISVPVNVSVDSIRDELEDLANELMVDITMDDLEGSVVQI
ncbi:glycine cleavage system protein R [Kiloniella laminariae]|uniref:glycine cleavage system protein R n=1 Tax=Kiloniella laminariae TaxID=454162 RepID=UPI00037DD674|nr:ACT domain-containing protein [Kiloniella laminariae]